MAGTPLLSIVTFLPLVGALFIIAIRGDDALAARNARYVALWTTIITFLVSLAGAPPMAGLIAKLFVFLATIEAGVYWLAVVMGVNTVVAAWYYLAVVKRMFFETPELDDPVEVPYLLTAAMGIAVAALVALLVYPPLLTTLADNSIF